MVQDNLTYYIEHPEKLDKDTLYELRMLVARYPYCTTLRLLLLNNLYLVHDVEFGRELRNAALCVTDRRVLFYLIEGSLPPSLEEEDESAEPGLDRTVSLIDTFLNHLPDERDALHVRGNPLTDYVSAYLMDLPPAVEEEKEDTLHSAARMRGQELIDSFLQSGGEEKIVLSPQQPPVAVPEPAATAESDDKEVGVEEEFFTETLAHIYIKQKKYAQALEIIRKLYLDYPNKNRYFADQIRFLEKLIVK